MGSNMRKESLEWGDWMKYGENVCVAGRWQGQSLKDEDWGFRMRKLQNESLNVMLEVCKHSMSQSV